MLNKWLLDDLSDLLPQAYCALCGGKAGAGKALCPECVADLPWMGGCCHHCARPLVRPGCCPDCQRRPPPYAGIDAAFHYAYPVDGLIRGLKFQGRLWAAACLGELMARPLLGETRPQLDAIVPVPLHPWRRAWRGYNQAEELARPLAAAVDLPVLATLVQRRRPTPPQTLLNRAQRRRNLRNAFRVCGEVGGLRLALVDDVVTTGATVGELARALRNAGAAEVMVWACARSMGGD